MTESVEGAAAAAMGQGKWRMVARLLGSVDLHFHFRTRPLRRFFARKPGQGSLRVLEYGCGLGTNLLELKARLPSMSGVGVDIASDWIGRANAIANEWGYRELRFICSDGVAVLDEPSASFDYILLIDVLEHLDRPEELLTQLERLLRPDGSFLISVPTHRYPKVFGRAFHEAVGHVRDGFNQEELDQLFGPGYVRTESSYNTGLLAGAACACFYRVLPRIKIRKLAILGTIGLHIFRVLDIFNGKSVSCSLWSVYRRSDVTGDRRAADHHLMSRPTKRPRLGGAAQTGAARFATQLTGPPAG